MNQSYYIDGDSVIVANEKGEMTRRDNHENIVEELQLENYLEECKKYNDELQKKINDLKKDRKNKLKNMKCSFIISGALCFTVLPLLSFFVTGMTNLIPVSLGISALTFAYVGPGFHGVLLTSVPSRKKISSLERKLKFSQDMVSELGDEAKKQIEDKRYMQQEKEISQQSNGEIHDVFSNQQLEDVNAVLDFIDDAPMSTSMLHDMATAGSLTELLYTHGYTPKQAELLTRYYSNVAVPESTLNKIFLKNKGK